MTHNNEETPEEILNYVLGTGIHNVTLTGGEPLLQKDIRNLIHLLLQAGLQVEVETNGAVALAAFVKNVRYLQWTISYHQAGAKNI